MQIDPHELAELLRRPEGERPFLLDVRSPGEHARCALSGATLIPLGELGRRLDELPADCEVVVYCHHGVRSLSAVGLLLQAGLRARSLRGGIDLWAQLIDPSLPRY
ncbi:MAG: rhodanese-like domain-containing protein [Myxococcales bacterium]